MINHEAIHILRQYYADFEAAAHLHNPVFENNVQRYLELKNLLHQVDVSTDEYFQRRYSYFYGLNQARLGHIRKAEYFRKFEEIKDTPFPINISELTSYLEQSLGKYHFSFCSKMANMINDEEYPIYDKKVRSHFRRRGLGRGHYYMNSIYIDITDTYTSLMNDPIIDAFKRRYRAQNMGYMKVLDTLFWAM